MKIISMVVSIVIVAMGVLLSISAIFEYDRKGDFDYADSQKSIEKYQNAKFFINDEKLNNDIGLELYDIAKENGVFTKKGQDSLILAEEKLKESLLKSPTDSNSWLKLADIQLMIGREYSEISQSVYMSAITAPYDFNLMNDRLKMAVIIWDYLDKDEKKYFEKQIQIFWKAKPVDIALQFEKRLDIASDVLNISEEEKLLKNHALYKEVKERSEDYLRLACIEFIKDGESYNVAKLLNKSMESAPYKTNIHLDRLKLVLRNWNYLNRAGRRLARQQIRIGLNLHPESMYRTFKLRKDIEIINAEIMAHNLS